MECSKSSLPEHAFCLVCRELCHAGHDVKPANNGKEFFGVCDCGMHKFDGNPELNNKNPLANGTDINKCFCNNTCWDVDTFAQIVIKNSGLPYIDIKWNNDENNFFKRFSQGRVFALKYAQDMELYLDNNIHNYQEYEDNIELFENDKLK
jgi:hypothetical protein